MKLSATKNKANNFEMQRSAKPTYLCIRGVYHYYSEHHKLEISSSACDTGTSIDVLTHVSNNHTSISSLNSNRRTMKEVFA